MKHLILCLAQLVTLSLSACPPPGPILPAPTHISTSPYFLAAATNLTSFLDSSLPFAPLNTTTFSIHLVSASSPNPLWSYYHTTPGSVLSSTTVDAHSQYRIGSVSKVFTDLLVLRLGLPLDAPVTKWLPKLRKGSGGVDWDAVTLRMLGSHMAGIQRNYNLWTQNYTNAATFEALGYPKLTPKDYPPCEVEELLGRSLGCTEKQVVQGMADSNPVFPPGLKPTYSNVGFNLLGFVIEKETGMTYEAAVKKYITQPLGMSRTGFLPARTNGVIPTVGLWHADLGQNNPAGGVYSTASDLSLLARSILTPTSGLLPPATLRSWLKPVVFGISSLTQAVGFPWEITRTTKLSRNGVIDIYTKDGGVISFGAIFSLIPEYAISVVVLTAGGNTGVAMYALADMVMATIVPSLEDVVRDEAKGYTGRYSLSNETWADIGMDDGPGLKITSWGAGGKEQMGNIAALGFDLRLYQSQIMDTGRGGQEELWWVAEERITKIPDNKSGILSEECGWMLALTSIMYGEQPGDKVIFRKVDAKVVGLEVPFLGVELRKE